MRFNDVIFVASTLMLGAGCNQSNDAGTGRAPVSDGGFHDDASAAPSFVIVHGSWMGAWAWSDVAAGLRAQGAEVQVVELPAHGADTTPVSEATLSAYVATVDTALDASSSPVILVGHSFGGVVITQAAEGRPSKIAKLVYLGAFLPQNGQSALQLAQMDANSHLGPVLEIDADAGTADVPLADLSDVFCADCSDAGLAELIAKYRSEPLAPLGTPVQTTAANWGAIAKYFVYTTQDHAISFPFQQQETSSVNFAGTAMLATSHSPFLSNPALVVTALMNIVPSP
jgi:pimeloyl-ACP methyl ester carboxylesterase